MENTQTTENEIKLYAHRFCPAVIGVEGMLKRSGAAYVYVDILNDGAGRQRVREINAGYESVPTLVFPDGSTLTEPSLRVLKSRLEALGYTVPLAAQIFSNWLNFILWGLLLLFILERLGVIG